MPYIPPPPRPPTPPRPVIPPPRPPSHNFHMQQQQRFQQQQRQFHQQQIHRQQQQFHRQQLQNQQRLHNQLQMDHMRRQQALQQQQQHFQRQQENFRSQQQEQQRIRQQQLQHQDHLRRQEQLRQDEQRRQQQLLRNLQQSSSSTPGEAGGTTVVHVTPGISIELSGITLNGNIQLETSGIEGDLEPTQASAPLLSPSDPPPAGYEAPPPYQQYPGGGPTNSPPPTIPAPITPVVGQPAPTPVGPVVGQPAPQVVPQRKSLEASTSIAMENRIVLSDGTQIFIQQEDEILFIGPTGTQMVVNCLPLYMPPKEAITAAESTAKDSADTTDKEAGGDSKDGPSESQSPSHGPIRKAKSLTSIAIAELELADEERVTQSDDEVLEDNPRVNRKKKKPRGSFGAHFSVRVHHQQKIATEETDAAPPVTHTDKDIERPVQDLGGSDQPVKFEVAQKSQATSEEPTQQNARASVSPEREKSPAPKLQSVPEDAENERPSDTPQLNEEVHQKRTKQPVHKANSTGSMAEYDDTSDPEDHKSGLEINYLNTTSTLSRLKRSTGSVSFPQNPITMTAQVTVENIQPLVQATEVQPVNVPTEQAVDTSVPTEQTVDTSVPSEQAVDTLVPTEQAVDTSVPTEQAVDTSVPSEQAVDTSVPSEQAVDTSVPSEQAVDTSVPSEQAVDTSVPSEQAVDTSVPSEQAVEASPISLEAGQEAVVGNGQEEPKQAVGVDSTDSKEETADVSQNDVEQPITASSETTDVPEPTEDAPRDSEQPSPATSVELVQDTSVAMEQLPTVGDESTPAITTEPSQDPPEPEQPTATGSDPSSTAEPSEDGPKPAEQPTTAGDEPTSADTEPSQESPQEPALTTDESTTASVQQATPSTDTEPSGVQQPTLASSESTTANVQQAPNTEASTVNQPTLASNESTVTHVQQAAPPNGAQASASPIPPKASLLPTNEAPPTSTAPQPTPQNRLPVTPLPRSPVTINCNYIERSGWLTKLSHRKGMFGDKWQKRYFVLNRSWLYYFKKYGDSNPRGVIRLLPTGWSKAIAQGTRRMPDAVVTSSDKGPGVMSVLRCLAVHRPNNFAASLSTLLEEDGVAEAFRSQTVSVSTPQHTSRTFYMTASSNEERDAWVRAINNNIQAYSYSAEALTIATKELKSMLRAVKSNTPPKDIPSVLLLLYSRRSKVTEKLAETCELGHVH